MKIKESFEKWAKSRDLDISPYTFNPKFKDEFDYNEISTQGFWECWQAASIQTSSVTSEKKAIFECHRCGVMHHEHSASILCCYRFLPT